MSGRRSKLKRKAARLQRTPIEQEFLAQRAELAKERDRQLAKASKEFRDELDKLKETLAAARKKAWDKYGEESHRLTIEAAAKEAKAA